MRSLAPKVNSLKLGMVALTCLYIALAGFSWSTLVRLSDEGRLFVSAHENPSHLFVSDFVQFYAMGKLSASSRRSEVYNPKVQDEYISRVISPYRTETPFFAQNVPWFFLLMVPFSKLSLTASFVVWATLGMIFGSVGLALVSRLIRQTDVLFIVLMLAAANACQPAWFVLSHGNTSWYLVGCVSLYCLGLFKGRDIAGGVGLALAAQKPHYAIMLSIPALRYRRWKLLLASLAVEVALWVWAVAAFGFPNVFHYPKMLLSVDGSNAFVGMSPMQMVSLRTFFCDMLPQGPCMSLSMVAFVIACAGLLFMWLKTSVSDTDLQRWAMATTITLLLVASPKTHLYDVLLLSVAAVMTLPIGSISGTRLGKSMATIWTLLLLTYPLTSWFLFLTESPAVLFQHKNLALLDVLLLVVCVTNYLCLKTRQILPVSKAER